MKLRWCERSSSDESAAQHWTFSTLNRSPPSIPSGECRMCCSRRTRRIAWRDSWTLRSNVSLKTWIDFEKESSNRITSYDWDGKNMFLLNDSIRNDGFGNLYLYSSETREATKLNPINGTCWLPM